MKRTLHASMLLMLFGSSPACGTDYQAGWPVPAQTAQITLANMDNDPEVEVIFTTFSYSSLNILNFDGTQDPPWPSFLTLSPGDIPLVGDLEGDGEVDIVFPYQGTGAGNQFNAVSASGVQKPGWPIVVDSHPNYLQPDRCLVDLNGDGSDEFLILGLVTNRLLHAYDYGGTPVLGWPKVIPVDVQPGESLYWTSLGAGDLDLDGVPEIMVGLYKTQGPTFIPSPVVVINVDGTTPQGWPAVPTAPQFGRQLVHPVMADLTGDLQCEVFGTGFHQLHSIRYDGTGHFPSSPAAWSGRPAACGNVDGSPGLEIVVPGERLQVFDSNGALLAQTDPSTFWLYEGITLGDVNGDGAQEICAVSKRNGTESEFWIHLFDQNLNELPTWPKFLSASAPNGHWTTALGDLDGDNDVEVITVAGGMVHVWDEPNPTGGPVSTDWPVWGHNAKRNNFYHEGNIPIRRHLPGDVNGDEVLDLSDPIELLSHLFVTAQVSPCLAAFDFNDTGSVDLADPITILSYLFAGVPPPGGVPQCGSSNTSPLPCARTGCP